MNFAGHKLQQKGLSPLCLFMWILSVPFCEKPLSHSWHCKIPSLYLSTLHYILSTLTLNGFSPVWILSWRSSKDSLGKVLPQYWHLQLFSCLPCLNLPFLSGLKYFLTSECLFKCNFRSPQLEKFSLQWGHTISVSGSLVRAWLSMCLHKSS